MSSNLKAKPDSVNQYIDGIVQGNQQPKSEAERIQKEREEMRQNFISTLRKTMLEDNEQNGAKGQGLLDKDANYYLTSDGQLTEGFMDELSNFKGEALKQLDQLMSNATQSQADCFGIKRKQCTVCENGCPGYQASSYLFSSETNIRSEFPTFCQVCGCPAHFHQVEHEQLKFPEELSQLLSSNNIISQDLNFNCVLATFLLEPKNKSKLNDITLLLKSQGIEVISLSTRYLCAEEAFLLRGRIVASKETSLKQSIGQSLKRITQNNEIKATGSLSNSHLDAMKQSNPFFIEKLSQIKQQIQSKSTSTKIDNQRSKTPNQITKTETSQQNSDNQNKNSQPDRRGRSQDRKHVTFTSVLETVHEESDDLERDVLGDNLIQFAIQNAASQSTISQTKADEVFQKINERIKLLPTTSSREPRLKIKSQIDSKTKKHKMLDKISEKFQIQFLVQSMEKNDLLKQLVNNEVAFLVLSSSSQQNLSALVYKTLFKIQEPQLLYYSLNKVQALEDCIHFVPQLFQLSRSIIVNEPLRDFTDQFKTSLSSDSYLSKLSLQDEHLRSTINSGKMKDTRRFGQIGQQTHFRVRRAVTLQSKLSSLNNNTQKTRQEATNSNQKTQMKPQLQVDVNQSDDNGISNSAWVLNIKNRDVNKARKLASRRNVLQFNYGVMRDYLSYAGMSIQLMLKCGDLSQPINPYGIRGHQQLMQSNNQNYSTKPQPCNIFAIAKVGIPNLIMPNSLDVKISNFENYDSYTSISDHFFPENSKNHQAVVVIRPMLVRNGLNDLLVQILKANEFVILNSKVRMLTKNEVMYLFNQENISKENEDLYVSLMLDGPCEVLVVSKVGAVPDILTILDGANPFGRRRLNQANEETSIRTNVDSVNAMFEIAPFTSFSELIDLEDFMVRNSKLSKFKKIYQNQGQLDEFLLQKSLMIHDEISQFQRFFNLVAVSSKTQQAAQKEICIFSPKVAQLEEIILVLNPIYNSIIEDAFEVLLRQNYLIIYHQYTRINESMCQQFFAGVIDFDSDQGKLFVEQMLQGKVHIFHLSRVGAEREARIMYQHSDLQVDDLLQATSFGSPLKPTYIPYIFLFIHQAAAFEECLRLLYSDMRLTFRGLDFFTKIPSQEMLKILQMCLLVTVGDTVKVLKVDTIRNTLQQVLPSGSDNFTPLMVRYMNSGDNGKNDKFEPQIVPDLYSLRKESPYFQISVETNNHGVFEIRFHNLKEWQNQNTLLHQFSTLKLFYNEVNRAYNNICPAYYRFKISHALGRVYEVEESMGNNFIEELAKLHHDHVAIVEHSKSLQSPKSLPAFLFGQKISQMCKKLLDVKTKVKGAGSILYNEREQVLQGELYPVTQSNYYFYDKQRYLGYLENFKKGWLYYLSVLETDIIEMKLNIILNSLTFRYTRQPEYLRLMPERITSTNLRISEKISIPSFENQDVQDAFGVDSIVQTLKHKHVSKMLEDKLRKEGKSLQNLLHDSKQVEFKIHKDVALAGFTDGIARRPKHQLIASIMWMIDFEYRKVNRRVECFLGNRNSQVATQRTEKEYDEILDILLQSAQEDYMRDQDLALNINHLKDGGFESDFEKHVREKQALDRQLAESLELKIEEEKRKLRCTMSIQELIRTEVHNAADEARKQQRLELKQFLDTRGGSDPEGKEFTDFLEKSKMNFGPFAVRLAQEFVVSQIKKKEKTINPLKKDQEFISFLKMEYFLYGVQEANHLIKQLCFMEDEINNLSDKFDKEQLELTGFQNQLRSLPLDTRFSAERTNVQQKIKDLSTKVGAAKQEIADYRFEITTKETELLQVFKELISCDFYVSDDYFEKTQADMLARKEKRSETFKVQLATFWRPVVLQEYIEPNLNNPKFQQEVGKRPNLSNQIGSFLAKPLQDAITPARREMIAVLEKGVKISNLNKTQVNQYPSVINLEKYHSKAELEQNLATQLQKKLIQEQTQAKIPKMDFTQ